VTGVQTCALPIWDEGGQDFKDEALGSKMFKSQTSRQDSFSPN